MTGKNIKGMRKGPSRSLRRKERDSSLRRNLWRNTPETWNGEGRADDTWRSLPAHELNIRTSQLTQSGVWGSKMIKCCLVWVQSNKSPLTEVTLHLEQVCRSVCQGSDKSKCWKQVCLCRGLLQNPWLWTGHLLAAVGQQFLHSPQQIHGVKHPGEIHVSNSLSDTHTSSTEALWVHTERISGILLQENHLFHSAIALNLAGAAEVAWTKQGHVPQSVPKKPSWLPILLFYFALARIICSIWTAKKPPQTPGEWCFW